MILCERFYVTSKHDNFKWVLIAVYEATQDEQNQIFLLN
jgi:hypothetical protein